MESKIQEIDYNTLLMNHLNRISAITTSNFIDMVNQATREEADISQQRPSSIGEISLRWGVKFLFAIVPSKLLDERFKTELQERREKNIDFMQKNNIRDMPLDWQFDKIKVMVNLLDRKGFLMPQRLPGKSSKKPNEEEPSVEFETP
jgi:hypothetical protein